MLACSADAGRRRGTVIFASGADLQSANPLLTTHPLARQVQRFVLLTTLVRYNASLVPEPYLAQRWEWSGDSLTLTMHLYPHLSWHDGEPTTSRDAAWTIDAARDPATGYPRMSELAGIVATSAPDDSTLTVRFARAPDGIPDVFTDLAILPQHRLGAVPRASMRAAQWNQSPVGNGPFRFVTHEPNRRWVFAADTTFPAVLGGPARIDRLVIAVVDEPTTKLAALAAGELDFAGINPAHASFVARNPDLAVLDYPLLFTYVMVFNTRRPPFDDVNVRQAIAAAIDRRAIVDGYLFGFGTPALDPIPPALARHGVSPVDTDRRRGGISRAIGPIRFELLTVGSGDAALEQMLQAQLLAIGVYAEIRQLELTSFLDRVHGPGHDFDAAVMGIPGDPALGHLRPLLGLAGLPMDANRDRLLGIFDEAIPVAFLYHARGVQGMNRRVRDVRMDVRGELASVRDWWVGTRP